MVAAALAMRRATDSGVGSPLMSAYLLDWLGLLVRWVHIVTGIAWIGASFYFLWLDNHLQAPPSAPQRPVRSTRALSCSRRCARWSSRVVPRTRWLSSARTRD